MRSFGHEELERTQVICHDSMANTGVGRVIFVKERSGSNKVVVGHEVDSKVSFVILFRLAIIIMILLALFVFFSSLFSFIQ